VVRNIIFPGEPVKGADTAYDFDIRTVTGDGAVKAFETLAPSFGRVAGLFYLAQGGGHYFGQAPCGEFGSTNG